MKRILFLFAVIFLTTMVLRAQLQFQPATVDFGQVTTGTSQTEEVILTSAIAQTINLSSLNAPFTIEPSSFFLEKDSSKVLLVTFSPVSIGSFQQTVTASGSIYGTTSLNLTGFGIQAIVSVSPDHLDFGNIPLLSSLTQQFNVSNSGNGLLICSLANSNSHFELSINNLQIPQNGSQQVLVTFTPDLVPAEFDTVLISTNDPVNPLIKFPLTGKGINQVSGNVCGTWYEANGPIMFSGNVTVPESCTLTIEPGVIVNMADYNFKIEGKLVCNGLINDSIRINGTGVMTFSTKYPSDSIQYVVIDGNSTSVEGLHIKTRGIKIGHSRIKAYKIENFVDFFDDFEDGTWEDKWTKTGTGNATLGVSNYYGYSGNGLRFNLQYDQWGSDMANIQTSPISITGNGLVTISLWFNIPQSSYGFTTFYWKKGTGSWQQFYQTQNSTTYPWTNLQITTNQVFNSNNLLYLKIESTLNNYYSSVIQQVFIDNVTINVSNTTLITENSEMTLNSIEHFSFSSENLSAIEIKNSLLYLDDGIKTFQGNCKIDVINSQLYNSCNAIKTFGDFSDINLFASIIKNSSGYGTFTCGANSKIVSHNSLISYCVLGGLYSNGSYEMSYSTVFKNGGQGAFAENIESSSIFNSIVCLNNNSYVNQIQSGIYQEFSKTTGDPKLNLTTGQLLTISPCIDAADPYDEDAHIPYGMGSIRADMGAFGGPDNWVWGGLPIPEGNPVINNIVDIPQDQGKKVGIQYKASLFDNGHTAYDVTRYSFWRELDENGKLPLEASKTPVGQFFQKGTNYWEYVGEMPANGFANYGYSATTLGDSTVSGMFWSKFLVVAHTSDDDIYWVSQPDSGYSVDNLAPAQPLNLAGTVAGVTYNLQWTPSPDEDFQYYAVYRAEGGIFGEEPFATTTEPEFSDITLNLEEQDFAVAAFDFSGNRSPLSNILTSPVYDLLEIPAGWSGISSWINPSEPSLGYLFAPASTNLIILQNMQGVYWPGQNVNTLGSWDDGAGYMIKMAEETQIPFIGHKNPENEFQLTAGWQILPVLTNCPLSVEELQNQLGSNLVMVKEIAGWRVFWPAMGISTLETLEPGKAYFLNTLTGNGQVVFGECE